MQTGAGVLGVQPSVDRLGPPGGFTGGFTVGFTVGCGWKQRRVPMNPVHVCQDRALESQRLENPSKTVQVH